MDDDGVSPVAPRAELPPEDRPPEPGRRDIPRGLLWALALAVVVLLIASWVALDAEQDARSSSTPGEVAVLDKNLPAGGNGLRNDVDLVGRPVPDVSYATFDGGSARLADRLGTPTVVNFWASTCVPCIEEMPALERLHQRYGNRVAFVGLASGDTEPGARRMAGTTGVTFDLGLDPMGEVARKFGVIGLPSTVLIDRAGTVVWFTDVPGAVDEATLATTIDEKLLA